MRKFSLIAGLSTSMLFLFCFGIFAQVENSDYTLYDANKTVPTNTDYVTIGTSQGYYVMPDTYYHPDYNVPGSWTLTAGFTWTWTIPTNPGTATITDANANDNYVQLNWVGLGSHLVNVVEAMPVGMGGCAGSTTVMNVEVINEPAVEITYVGSSANCGTLANQNVTIRLRGLPPFRLVWDYEEINIESDATETSLSTTATTQAAPLTINQVDLTNISTYVWEYTLDATKSFTILNNKRTKYVYTVTEANESVSRKSDYLSGPSAPEDYTYYNNIVDLNSANGAQATVEIIVNPAPSTGTIYHIAN